VRETAGRARTLDRRARAAAAVVERARVPAAALARGASLETRHRELERPVAMLTRAATVAARRRELERLAATLAAHDPQRTLERGYALLEDPAGEPVTSAAAAAALPRLTARLHDGRVAVRPERA
jgi:exodeoxyribonuclease VII large subunit